MQWTGWNQHNMNMKQLEDRCLQLEAEIKILKKIIEKSPGHIYWKDKNGHYITCNSGQAKAAGFCTPEAFSGKTDYDMPWQRDADRIRETDNAILHSGTESICEETISINAQELNFISTKTPVYDDHGNPIGLIGISIDITDKKRAEALARELEIQKQVTEKTKIWAGAIAHEVRTPVLSVKLNNHLLAKALNPLGDDPSPEALKRAYHHIKDLPQDINRGLVNADHVIDMTLMKAKSGDDNAMALHPLSIQQAVETAISHYPFQGSDRTKIQLNLETDFQFNGNQAYFDHVMFNLIKNALYFIKQQGKGDIFITTRTDKNANILIFKDTAIGVKAADLAQFFKPFFSKSHNGTGVGLSFCKDTLEAFGGSIQATSCYGEHMTFEMRFPIVAND